jgi:inner membrane protein
MDPLAHTLVGATLAKSGLERRSRFAATALLVGANLPDVDAVTYFVSGDLGLFLRRGWTHGALALAVWPVLLAGALFALDRVLGSRSARFGALLFVSFLAVLTHPSLDWLNTYGMRWLMPFDGRWFYGDALFIVDPWLWLCLGGAAFLASSGGALRTLGWALVAAGAAVLLWRGVEGLLPAKLAFVSAIAIFAALRLRGLPRTAAAKLRLARMALTVSAIYVIAMVALSYWGRTAVMDLLPGDVAGVQEIMVGPRPVVPYRKDVLIATEDVFRFGTLDLWPRPRLQLSPELIRRAPHSPIVERALERPEVRGFAAWARYIWFRVEETPEVYRVRLMDARYVREETAPPPRFGAATVLLPR